MGKKFELIECSIVAAGKNHNPSILNPDFLKRNKIVPEEGWEAEKILATDVFSQVAFKNGIVITVEPQKIIFLDNDPSRSISEPALDDIAISYIKKLPHVTYTAVGINFKYVVFFKDKEEAERFVLDKIVSPGSWKDISGGLHSANLKFIYQVDGGVLNLSIDPAAFQKAGQPEVKDIIAISANFHRDIPKEPESIIKRIEEIIRGWERDRDSLVKMIETIFE
jgi:hypothetical protein